MLTRALFLLPLALVAAACGGSSEAIKLAKAIGPVRLQTPRSRVESRLGAGKVVLRGPFTKVRYERQALLITYEDHKVQQIATRAGRYRTTQGVHVGSTVAEMRKTYPRVRCQGEDCGLFPKNAGFRTGMTTFTVRGDRVAAIVVAYVEND